VVGDDFVDSGADGFGDGFDAFDHGVDLDAGEEEGRETRTWSRSSRLLR
jgi:hypothetical protein